MDTYAVHQRLLERTLTLRDAYKTWGSPKTVIGWENVAFLLQQWMMVNSGREDYQGTHYERMEYRH